MTSRPSPEPAQVAAAPTDGPVLGTRILQSEACADAQYVIAALLPPRDAAALSGVNKDYYFIARSPLIWASHVQHVRKTNPEVQAPLEEYQGVSAEGRALRRRVCERVPFPGADAEGTCTFVPHGSADGPARWSGPPPRGDRGGSACTG